jgi:hypothetical protein
VASKRTPGDEEASGGAGVGAGLAKHGGIAQIRFDLGAANETSGCSGRDEREARAPGAVPGFLVAQDGIETGEGSSGKKRGLKCTGWGHFDLGLAVSQAPARLTLPQILYRRFAEAQRCTTFECLFLSRPFRWTSFGRPSCLSRPGQVGKAGRKNAPSPSRDAPAARA